MGGMRTTNAYREIVVQVLSHRAWLWPRRGIFRWHKEWLQDARLRVLGPKGRRLTVIRKKPLQNKVVAFQRRQRNNGAGRPHKCPLLRVALYEWWTSLRYSIDWEAVKASFGKQAIKSGHGQRKALARYSAALLRKKVALNEF